MGGFRGVHFMKKIDWMTFRGSKMVFSFLDFSKNVRVLFLGGSGGAPEIFFAKKFFSLSTLNIFRKSQEK